MTIVQNEAQCRKCGEIIFSRHTHDFVACSCGAIAVDGGISYIRRVGNPEDFIDRSLQMDEIAINNCIAAVDWGIDTGRNSRGIVYAVIRALRDSGYIKIPKVPGVSEE
jgi:hypothetical protein